MDITTNKTVNYEVNKISINNIMINLFRNRLDINAPFEWKDSNGAVVRKGGYRLTEEDLIKMDANNSVLISKLKAILPSTGTMKNMSIRLGDTITARSNYNNIETKKWETISYTQEQFEALLSTRELSIEAIKQIISGLAITLT
jgi:hypothetical protein